MRGTPALRRSFRSGAGCRASLRCCWRRSRLDPARDTLGTAGHLTLTLPAAVTQALLTRVPAAFHGGINDVLLTGLALAVADWCRRHVQGAGGPGRECGADRHWRAQATRCCSISRAMVVKRCLADVDLTRTVGWFTSLYPVRLDPGRLDLEEALCGGAALGRALKTIKEQLRAVPGKGLGYGLLRYLNDADGGGSWLGRRRRSSASTIWAALRPAATARTGRRPAWMRAQARPAARWAAAIRRCRWRTLIEINALTQDGADGPALTAHWTWASALLDEAAVRDLAGTWLRALTALVRHAGSPARAAGRQAMLRWLI